nr:hypothetical protein [Pseudomonas versuta]
MPLTKPNQALNRDLQGIASDLKWSAVELKRIAERLSQSGHEADAQAVLKMRAVFHAGKGRLAKESIAIRLNLPLDEMNSLLQGVLRERTGPARPDAHGLRVV